MVTDLFLNFECFLLSMTDQKIIQNKRSECVTSQKIRSVKNRTIVFSLPENKEPIVRPILLIS